MVWAWAEPDQSNAMAKASSGRVAIAHRRIHVKLSMANHSLESAEKNFQNMNQRAGLSDGPP
jgi:hypothetical protein